MLMTLAIRTLPYPKLSKYNFEDIELIKAIPLDEIDYTDSEVCLMERAVETLDHLLAHWPFLEQSREIKLMLWERLQFEEVLTDYMVRKRLKKSKAG